MPSLPKYRKAKRPTVLVNIRSQRSRKSLVSKSRSPIYEQLKANNIALAKALSKEKQECHYLFTQNLHLTSQLQERDSSINQRDAAMRGILKNSSELLAYLVESTDRVTRTIAACQQFVGIHRVPSAPSPSVNSVARRESARRSTGKSPARGVVQPMVSGHTITKPVINLSRINAPRIRASPNLSDIEETLSSPESNQNRTEATSNLRIVNSIRNPPILLTRHVDGLLPERIRLTSPRVSDETERISDQRGRRLSDRHSSRHSRKLSRISDQLSPNQSRQSDGDTSQSSRISENLHDIRNPRVALEDVSKLLRKSRSLNVKILSEASELEQSNSNLEVQPSEKPRNATSAESQGQEFAAGSTPMDDDASPTYNFDPRLKEMKKKSQSDDPLEGPSWAHNNFEFVDAHQQSNDLTDNLLLSDRNSAASKSNSTRRMKTEAATVSRKSRRKNIGSKWTANSYQRSPPSSEDDQTNDDERCQNVSQLLNTYNSPNNVCHPPDLTRLPENITRYRGQPKMVDDDLTLLLNQQMQQQDPEPFEMSELELPNLEMPLVNPAVVEPEPEITTTVRMLTQTLHRMPSMCVGNMSLMGNKSAVVCPDVGDSMHLTMETEDEIADEPDDEETENAAKVLLKRKRTTKTSVESTSSESESSVSPKKLPFQSNNVTRRRDPGSARVVLEKLESSSSSRKSLLSTRASSCTTQLSLSMQSEVYSDSESSTASSKLSTTRPRRKKAPTNLAEPKLNIKMRR